MSKLGIVYLIQPYEFIETNIYKIGCSSKNSLDRCKNGYSNGTEFINICSCYNPFELEGKIKIRFNELFTLKKGREYFEGNIKEMKKEFDKLVEEHKDFYKQLNRIKVDEDDNNDINIDSDIDESDTENINIDNGCNYNNTKNVNINIGIDKTNNKNINVNIEIGGNNDNFINNIKVKKNKKKIIEFKYSCKLCNFQTNKRTDYFVHLNTNRHYKKIFNSKYICYYCNKPLSTKYTYKYHLLKYHHTDNKDDDITVNILKL